MASGDVSRDVQDNGWIFTWILFAAQIDNKKLWSQGLFHLIAGARWLSFVVSLQHDDTLTIFYVSLCCFFFHCTLSLYISMIMRLSCTAIIYSEWLYVCRTLLWPARFSDISPIEPVCKHLRLYPRSDWSSSTTEESFAWNSAGGHMQTLCINVKLVNVLCKGQKVCVEILLLICPLHVAVSLNKLCVLLKGWTFL